MPMESVLQIPLYEKPLLRGRHAAEPQSLRPRPFVVGPENSLVNGAVCEILADSQDTFPVIFTAPFGFGKSHLASGLFHTWMANHPECTGKLLTARDFIKQWTTFASTDTLTEFYRIFTPLALLVIEDLQEIVETPMAEEVLVDLLDHLRQHGAKTLFTSSVPLNALTLVPWLASRLRGGVCVAIQPPKAEARREILALADEREKLKITQEAVELLAEYSALAENSVFEMLNIRKQLDMERRTARAPSVTTVEVRTYFNQKAEACSISIADVAKIVVKYYKIRLADVRGKSRKATFVIARDVIYYLLRRMTNFTLTDIGDYFGGRDHTTILHGCHKTEERMKTEPAVRRAVETLYAELRPMIDSPVK